VLTRLKVQGFKTLIDFDAPLSKVTVLVGPNNAGKSNILKALGYLSDVARAGSIAADSAAGGVEELTTRGRRQSPSFLIEAELAGSKYTYEFCPNGPWSGGQPKESLTVHGKRLIQCWWTPQGSQLQVNGVAERPPGASTPGELLNAVGRWGSTEEVTAFHSFLSGMIIADLSADSIREPSEIVPLPTLHPSGRGLAAVLDGLQSKPLMRAAIDEAIRQAIPSVSAVVTLPDDKPGYKVVGVAEGNTAYRARHVSDGVLLFIAITTVSQMSGGKTVIALEEPDKGIHPRRIVDIIDQVNRIANQGTQFLITTHSPVLLNAFRDFPESVLIVDRGDRGTVAKRLSDMPNIEEQLRDVQLGDLWYSGVLGGVPTP
jgi:predicted ATPase